MNLKNVMLTEKCYTHKRNYTLYNSIYMIYPEKSNLYRQPAD